MDAVRPDCVRLDAGVRTAAPARGRPARPSRPATRGWLLRALHYTKELADTSFDWPVVAVQPLRRGRAAGRLPPGRLLAVCLPEFPARRPLSRFVELRHRCGSLTSDTFERPTTPASA